MAGIEGAAMATVGAMLILFFLFFRRRPPDPRAARFSWWGGGVPLPDLCTDGNFWHRGYLFPDGGADCVRAVLRMVGFLNPRPGNKTRAPMPA